MIKFIKSNPECILVAIMLLSLFCYLFAAYKTNINIETKSEDVFGQNLGRNDIFSDVKLEGWNSAWFTQPEFDGNDMPADALVQADNIDFDVKKSIAPRQGTEILGTESTSKNPVKSLHTSKALDGRDLLVRSHSTVLEWWNPDGTTWENLDTDYTSDKDFTFTDGMTSTETANYTYFSNGAEALKRFRIAFGSLATTTGSTTTLNSVTGFDSADDIGFNTTGTVRIDGANYTYTGISGFALTGMSGVPTSLSANEGIISAVETSGFTDAPSTTVALVIKDQRLYAAQNNSVFCSNIDDFQDFSFSAPRVASEGEVVIFPEGGDKINGLAVRPNYVAVMKKDYIGSLEFKDFSVDLSDIPVVKTIVKEIDVGAVNQKSIINKNFSVLFSNNDIGLSELTRLENKDFDESISILERIRPSIEDYTLSDTAIGILENRIIQAVNDDSTFNNRMLVFDFERNRITQFAGLNASSFATYNDNLYYGDSINQNVYKMFIGKYNDNDRSYTTEWKTKWHNFGFADQWKEIERVYVEGFITKNTTIDFTVNLNEGGSLSTKTISISGMGDYVAQSTSKGFGTNPFGLVNFTNVSGSTDNLLHFGGYILLDDMNDKKFRNIQFAGKTSGTGQNYRISKIIPYIHVLDATYGLDYSENIIND